jgi:hypothetical protein
MGIINTILFVLPFVSAVFLFFSSKSMSVLYGIILIVLTILFFSVTASFKRDFSKKLSQKALSYLMPAYYFASVIVSITLSWKLINSNDAGNVWVALFAFSCCYVPYNYMFQGEQAKTGKVGILTNTINNYSIIGYLLFGSLMNFTSIGIVWSYVLLVSLGLLFLNGLPHRIMKEIKEN